MTKRRLAQLDLDILFIFLVMLTASFLFTTHFIHPFITSKETVFQIFVLIMAVVTTQRFFRIKPNLTDALVIAWLTWQVGSIGLTSGFPVMIQNGQLSIFILLFYLIIRTVDPIKTRFASIAYTISLVALIQASVGLLQFFDLFPWTSQLFQGYESPVTGTVGGANVLGALLAISLPFVYFNIKQSRSMKKGIWIVTLLMIVATLVLTKSRGAWIASLVGLGVFLLPILTPWLKRMQRRKMALLFISLSSVAIIGFFFQKLYNLNVASADGRLFIWSVSWDMIKDHFLTGVGHGQFRLHWLDYQGAYFARDLTGDSHNLAVSLTSAHSQYLHSLAETGVIGLALFVGVVSSSLMRVKRGFRTLINSDSTQTLVFTSALVTFLIHGIVEDVLVSTPVVVLFITLIALIANETVYPILLSKAPNSYLVNLVRAILLVALAFSLKTAHHKIQGELLWKEGQAYAQKGHWETGIQKYKDASIYLPDNAELKFYLGAAYSKISKPDLALKYLQASQIGFIDKNQLIALGKAYIDLGQYDLAIQSLNRVLYFYPKLLSPHFWLSRTYFELGDVEQARNELQIILKAKNTLNSNEIELVKKDAMQALWRLENRH